MSYSAYRWCMCIDYRKLMLQIKSQC